MSVRNMTIQEIVGAKPYIIESPEEENGNALYVQSESTEDNEEEEKQTREIYQSENGVLFEQFATIGVVTKIHDRPHSAAKHITLSDLNTKASINVVYFIDEKSGSPFDAKVYDLMILHGRLVFQEQVLDEETKEKHVIPIIYVNGQNIYTYDDRESKPEFIKLWHLQTAVTRRGNRIHGNSRILQELEKLGIPFVKSGVWANLGQNVLDEEVFIKVPPKKSKTPSKSPKKTSSTSPKKPSSKSPKETYKGIKPKSKHETPDIEDDIDLLAEIEADLEAGKEFDKNRKLKNLSMYLYEILEDGKPHSIKEILEALEFKDTVEFRKQVADGMAEMKKDKKVELIEQVKKGNLIYQLKE